MHYHFVDPSAFGQMESAGEFVHLKRSDYDESSYGISRSALEQLLQTDTIPCFTAHGIDEALEVSRALEPLGIQFSTILVYSPEDVRVRRLLETRQREKLVERYHADVAFKVVAWQNGFQGTDFVVLNDRNRVELEQSLKPIADWLLGTAKAKPDCVSTADRIAIGRDVEGLLSSTERSLPPEPPANAPDLKDAILAEYEVLRDEIKQYHGERTTHINFAVGVTVGMLALLGSKDPTGEYRSWVLVLAPYVYSVLACMFLDRSLRIIRVADYIENDMRPRIEELLRSPVWRWENYKRETTRFPRWVSLWLDRLRLLVFVLPAASCWVAWLVKYRSIASTINLSLGFAAPFVIVLILLINRLTQESSGAMLRMTKTERK